MNGRSYAQITWSKGRLALDMVNTRGHRFIIYAEPLTRLVRKAGEYVLVKRRDRRPEKAYGHHGGDIWARMEDAKDDWKLTFFFGALDQKLCLDDDGNLLYWIGIQVHVLPKSELQNISACLLTMLDQMRSFDRLKIEADTSTEDMEYRR